jgi:hypothetical protein
VQQFPPASTAGNFYYKAVARVGPKLVSIFDGKTEYTLGTTISHPEVLLNPSVQFPPGYYLYSTPEDALNANVPTSAALFVAPRIIIKCIAWGPVVVPASIRLGSGTVVMAHVRPVEVIPLPLGAKNHLFTRKELTEIKLAHAHKLASPFDASSARNARPLERSPADRDALTQTVLSMESTLRDAARRHMAERTTLTPGFQHLINRSQISGIRRYVLNHTFDHSVLQPPVQQTPVTAETADKDAFIFDEYGQSVKLE